MNQQTSTAAVRSRVKLILVSGLLCSVLLSSAVFAASSTPLAGQILGQVNSITGVAQMGASVYLFNRYDELVRQSLSDAQGRFVFDALTPDIYSIRVVLASFMPAERRNIAVMPNSENRLQINLASVFSSVELMPSSAIRGTLMTDDWKWVLRSSQATRPVMRYLPDLGLPSTSKHSSATFSNTTGVLKLSAGEGSSFTQGATEDLGTAFAVATSLAGSGRVEVSGNVGYAGTSTLPAAGFRTTYSRASAAGSSPEVVVMMRQLYLGPRTGTGIAVGTDSAPVLRTMSAAFLDKFDAADNIRIDYGFDFQSVSYVDRLNYASPFLRATYDAGSLGRMRVGFSSGAAPVELLARDGENAGAFDHDLAALAMLPRISLSDSHVAVQRTQNYEISYERAEGSRTYTAGVYRESVTNAAYMLSGADNLLPINDLMPDLTSNSSILNIGSYQRVGYNVAVAQALGEHAEIAVAAGHTGALTVDLSERVYSNSNDLRAGIRQTERPWVTVRASGIVPKSGTKITADYGWTDFSTLMPTHVFLTQKSNQDIGVNIFLRQPLPMIFPWRMEVTAEMRNMLAQGYLPLVAPGTRAVLTNSPRAVRGGLSIIF